jgi:hypothetical protein
MPFIIFWPTSIPSRNIMTKISASMAINSKPTRQKQKRFVWNC